MDDLPSDISLPGDLRVESDLGHVQVSFPVVGALGASGTVWLIAVPPILVVTALLSYSSVVMGVAVATLLIGLATLSRGYRRHIDITQGRLRIEERWMGWCFRAASVPMQMVHAASVSEGAEDLLSIVRNDGETMRVRVPPPGGAMMIAARINELVDGLDSVGSAESEVPEGLTDLRRMRKPELE